MVPAFIYLWFAFPAAWEGLHSGFPRGGPSLLPPNPGPMGATPVGRCGTPVHPVFAFCSHRGFPGEGPSFSVGPRDVRRGGRRHITHVGRAGELGSAGGGEISIPSQECAAIGAAGGGSNGVSRRERRGVSVLQSSVPAQSAAAFSAGGGRDRSGQRGSAAASGRVSRDRTRPPSRQASRDLEGGGAPLRTGGFSNRSLAPRVRAEAIRPGRVRAEAVRPGHDGGMQPARSTRGMPPGLRVRSLYFSTAMQTTS